LRGGRACVMVTGNHVAAQPLAADDEFFTKLSGAQQQYFFQENLGMCEEP